VDLKVQERKTRRQGKRERERERGVGGRIGGRQREMVGATEEMELQKLERDVEGGGGDVAQYLALVRKLRVRRSSTVARHGLALLNNSSARSKLGADGMRVSMFPVSRACFVTILWKMNQFFGWFMRGFIPL